MAVKHLQRWTPLRVSHQRNWCLASQCLSNKYTQFITDYIITLPIHYHSQDCNTVLHFTFSLEHMTQRLFFLFSIQINLNPKLVPVVPVVATSPLHIATTKQNVFYQSLNVQTCEFKRVHRRNVWWGTHAAFLSYDLITCLCSSNIVREQEVFRKGKNPP